MCQVFESRSLHGDLLCDFFIMCSIIRNFACTLKQYPGFLKCKSTGIDFGMLTSFLWLFSIILKVVSVFPTYRTKNDEFAFAVEFVKYGV